MTTTRKVATTSPRKDSNTNFHYMRRRTNKCIMLLVLSVLAACLGSVDSAPQACEFTNCSTCTNNNVNCGWNGQCNDCSGYGENNCPQSEGCVVDETNCVGTRSEGGCDSGGDENNNEEGGEDSESNESNEGDNGKVCQNTACPPTGSDCSLVNKTIPPTCNTLERVLENCNIPTQNCLDTWDVGSVENFAFIFDNVGSEINGLTNWDTSSGIHFTAMFFGATAFNQSLNWDTSSGTDFAGMFLGATSFNQPLDWNTSSGTDFAAMFQDATSFNQSLDWNTSSGIRFTGMFDGATSFNQPLDWDTSSGTDFAAMFQDATSFNQSLDWNTSSGTDFAGMFQGATSFNQPLDWNTSSGTDFAAMFQDATSFNQSLDWNTSSGTDFTAMFQGATSFNQPLDWDTSSGTDFAAMFQDATSFNQSLDWDTSSGEHFGYMFEYAESFNQPLNFDTSRGQFFTGMFAFATAFNQPLNWNTSRGDFFSGMFYGATAFNQDISGWDVSSAAPDVDGNNPFVGIFTGATAFLNGPYANKTRDCWAHISPLFRTAVNDGITGLTAPIENMADADYDERCLNSVDAAPSCQSTSQCPNSLDCSLVNKTIPSNCTSLEYALRMCNIPAQNCFDTWDVSSVTHFNNMFSFVGSEIDGLTNWDTSSGTNFESMFFQATAFNQPLNWDTSSVRVFSGMFMNTNAFNQLLNWNTSSGELFLSMFNNAGAFNQDISGWDVSSARLDSQINPFDGIFTGATDFLNGPYANKTRDCWAHISTHFETAVYDGITGLTGPIEEMTKAEYDERCGTSSETDNDDSKPNLGLILGLLLGISAVLGAIYACRKYRPTGSSKAVDNL